MEVQFHGYAKGTPSVHVLGAFGLANADDWRCRGHAEGAEETRDGHVLSGDDVGRLRGAATYQYSSHLIRFSTRSTTSNVKACANDLIHPSLCVMCSTYCAESERLLQENGSVVLSVFDPHSGHLYGRSPSHSCAFYAPTDSYLWRDSADAAVAISQEKLRRHVWRLTAAASLKVSNKKLGIMMLSRQGLREPPLLWSYTTVIDLSHNSGISFDGTFERAVAAMKTLREMYLNNCGAVPRTIRSESLRVLDISYNSCLPASIDAPALVLLDISYNGMQKLPKYFRQFRNLRHLGWYGMESLTYPPRAVMHAGAGEVVRFFGGTPHDAREDDPIDQPKDRFEPIFKMMVLGDGRAGKTTLLLALEREAQHQRKPLYSRIWGRGGAAIPDQESTFGINIGRKSFIANTNHDMRVFDFAGQLEYMTTHQFFLSRHDVVYVVVGDASAGLGEVRHRILAWCHFLGSSIEPKLMKANNVGIFIVASKADKLSPPELERCKAELKALALLMKRKGVDAASYVISGKNGNGVQRLHDDIGTYVNKCAEAYEVPPSYTMTAEEVSRCGRLFASRASLTTLPYVRDVDFHGAMQLLHDRGETVWLEHAGVVCTDPQLLALLVAAFVCPDEHVESHFGENWRSFSRETVRSREEVIAQIEAVLEHHDLKAEGESREGLLEALLHFDLCLKLTEAEKFVYGCEGEGYLFPALRPVCDWIAWPETWRENLKHGAIERRVSMPLGRSSSSTLLSKEDEKQQKHWRVAGLRVGATKGAVFTITPHYFLRLQAKLRPFHHPATQLFHNACALRDDGSDALGVVYLTHSDEELEGAPFSASAEMGSPAKSTKRYEIHCVAKGTDPTTLTRKFHDAVTSLCRSAFRGLSLATHGICPRCIRSISHFPATFPNDCGHNCKPHEKDCGIAVIAREEGGSNRIRGVGAPWEATYRDELYEVSEWTPLCGNAHHLKCCGGDVPLAEVTTLHANEDPKTEVRSREWDRIMSIVGPLLEKDPQGHLFMIDRVDCIRNVTLHRKFKERFVSMVQASGQRGVSESSTSSSDNDDEKTAYWRKWLQQHLYSYTGLQSGNDTVNLVPALHGTSLDISKLIAQSGFRLPSSGTDQIDDGYFGLGIYHSQYFSYVERYIKAREKKYKLPPGSPVMLSWVLMGRVFPVCEHPFLSEVNFRGKECKSGFDSHYTVVSGSGISYYPCKPNEPPNYDEIVSFSPDVILPSYLLYYHQVHVLVWVDPNTRNNDNVVERLPQWVHVVQVTSWHDARVWMDGNNEHFKLIEGAVQGRLRMITNRFRADDGRELAGKIACEKFKKSRWGIAPCLLYCGNKSAVASVENIPRGVYISSSRPEAEIFASFRPLSEMPSHKQWAAEQERASDGE